MYAYIIDFTSYNRDIVTLKTSVVGLEQNKQQKSCYGKRETKNRNVRSVLHNYANFAN